MRLWHYELLPYLPRQQLLAQWRELNVIFKKEQRHVLWNYVYKSDVIDLLHYSSQVIAEMKRRGYKIRSYDSMIHYFEKHNVDFTVISIAFDDAYRGNPFPEHHTNSYLLQCFFNLQEKHSRGMDGITDESMEKMTLFVVGKFSEIRLYDAIMFFK